MKISWLKTLALEYIYVWELHYEIVVKFLSNVSNEKWFPRKNIPSITNLFFDKSENRSFIYLFFENSAIFHATRESFYIL